MPFLILLLFSQTAIASAEPIAPSHLNWCGLFESNKPKSPQFTKALKRVEQVSEQALKLEFPALKVLNLEGTLERDPRHQSSSKAVANFHKILSLSFCARLAKSPLNEKCRDKAVDGILNWARIYIPKGNPIDENQFIPLILATDALSPILADEKRDEIFKFFTALVQKSDSYYLALKPSSDKIFNNWGTWRLALRALIAVTTNNKQLMTETTSLFKKHIEKNLTPEGASIDFAIRDALHYHVYDMEAFVYSVAFAPQIFAEAEDRAKILAGLMFLEKFYSGKESHVEFKKSKVKFDSERRDAGQESFKLQPWQPKGARKLLRLGRWAFPEIKNWTANTVDESYDPSIKLVAAACE